VSTADQILSAKISALCRRHCARGEVDDLDEAVAELQALAGSRPDVLAEHAGVSLGWAQVIAPAEARCFQAEAELARAAGADEAQIPGWIETGRKRAEQAHQQPYAGQP
jgi:hypothetical protein